MARFRGTVKGGRGEASRLGHRSSGLCTKASGWNGTIVTEIYAGPNDEDWARVMHVTNESTVVLYYGPLNHHVDPRGRPLPIDEK